MRAAALNAFQRSTQEGTCVIFSACWVGASFKVCASSPGKQSWWPLTQQTNTKHRGIMMHTYMQTVSNDEMCLFAVSKVTEVTRSSAMRFFDFTCFLLLARGATHPTYIWLRRLCRECLAARNRKTWAFDSKKMWSLRAPMFCVNYCQSCFVM